MSRSIVSSLIVTVILFSGVVMTSCSDKEKTAKADAIDAAEKWLALIDGGDYAQSWEETAEAFRNVLTKENLMEQGDGERRASPFNGL